MSRMTRTLLAGLALVATTAVASADIVDRRQADQQAKIQAGIRNGSITRQEAAKLQHEQARIAEFERRAKADGRLDSREAAILNRAQNNADRHIYQESHDRDVRGRGGHGHGGWGFRRWW